MKPSPKAITAILLATLTVLATAAVTETPSAAHTHSSRLPTPTSTPGPTPAAPALGAESVMGLIGIVAPPPAPTVSRVPVTVPVPGQPLTLPILYMHQVVTIPSDIGSWSAGAQQAFFLHSIPACAFEAQLDWLRAHAYHTVLPRDLIAFWDQGVPLPANPIILTFDDGSPDWYSTIFPALQAHGFTAEFYVTLQHVGSAISWDQLREMAAAGMGIGAHDVNHFQLVGGSTVPASVEVMRYQVAEAKRVLESQLGIRVESMAYVGGGYDATLMSLVQEAGYSSARAVNRGVWQEPGARYRLRISRVGFWDDIIGGTFENAINCAFDPAMSTFESRVAGTNPG
jgi:peptidoglycan/xylan/chitin deacetylase (PgdA/CDA1 family)